MSTFNYFLGKHMKLMLYSEKSKKEECATIKALSYNVFEISYKNTTNSSNLWNRKN